MYATQTAQETARDAVQIFGGRGITRTGMGRFIEHVSSGLAPFFLEQATDGVTVSPNYSV
jgi:alkylation response protein AidB-like acyl-CoA dehydrogenase